MFKINYINDVKIINKKVLLRVDYNVPLNENNEITDDSRIIQTLPTLNLLLEKNNRIILISHLGRPQKKDSNLSLKPVALRLQKLLPKNKIILVKAFIDKEITQKSNKEILLFENIRFYPEEENNNPNFAKKIASLADIYVNDAFSVCHRQDASIVSITKFLPSFGGLLLHKEIDALSKLLQNPAKPYLAIISGIKTKTKIPVISKLIEVADILILGGGIAHTFLKAKGVEIGKSIFDASQIEIVKKILQKAQEKKIQIVLPSDLICAENQNERNGVNYDINHIPKNLTVYDIGEQTEKIFTKNISKAKTIIWNGPLGYIENPFFRKGTNQIFQAIINNNHAFSVIGGGDTLRTIANKQSINKVSYVSTGGGAMLEFIAKGTLPGIQALEK